MQTLAELILHIGLVLLLAPLPGGLIRKIKAFSQKRQGPPLLQEYRDLRKLFRKDVVLSERASWVFSAAPFVVFGSSVAAAALVPLLPWAGGAEFPGDVFLVISLLALGRFFLGFTCSFGYSDGITTVFCSCSGLSVKVGTILLGAASV